MDQWYVVAAVVDADERHYAERTRLRSLRDHSNPFELAEAKFNKIFRIKKASARNLCELLDTKLTSTSIPNHLKVLAALHFYADGSYQTPVGEDSLLSMSQPSVCRAIEETTEAIVGFLSQTYIKFPTTVDEKENTMREFQEKFNMPNVLGAVDGSQISIFKPRNSDPMAPGIIFFNRKGFYSINCLVVTNAQGRIIFLNPNFPGSTHDAAVWRSSAIARHLEREFVHGQQDQYLIGDKGYPLLPWLMTPIAAPETQAEENYNRLHCKARNVVETSFGRLKNKFRCLHKHRTLHYSPKKAAKIIIACCTLYNMFCNADELDEDDEEDADDDVEDGTQNNINEEEMETNANYLAMARAKRLRIIEILSNLE